MNTKTTVISQAELDAQFACCDKIAAYWQTKGRTPTAYVDTYGCQQNEADSERIRGYARRDGLRHRAATRSRPGSSSSTPAPSGSTPSSGCSAIWAPWPTPSAATRSRSSVCAAAWPGRSRGGRAGQAQLPPCGRVFGPHHAVAVSGRFCWQVLSAGASGSFATDQTRPAPSPRASRWSQGQG